MELTVHKFSPLDLGFNVIKINAGAKILTVAYQNSKIQLWALVDKKADSVDRVIGIAGTGWAITETPGVGMSIPVYIATIQNLHFVWHVFDHGEVLKSWGSPWNGA